MAQMKAVLVELVPRWRFLGIEGGVEGRGGSGELLVGGEERIGRGVKLANPSMTMRPADGLYVRFERRV